MHKPNIQARLLTTGCNTAIENQAIFVEKHCATLTEKIPRKITDSYYLFDISETLNATGIPDNAILMPFNTVNIFIVLTIIEVLLLKKVLLTQELIYLLLQNA